MAAIMTIAIQAYLMEMRASEIAMGVLRWLATSTQALQWPATTHCDDQRQQW